MPFKKWDEGGFQKGWGKFTPKRQEAFRKAQYEAWRKRGKKANKNIREANLRTSQRRANQGILKDLKDWTADGLGFGRLSKDEIMYWKNFRDDLGRNPKPWENPYMIERYGKMVDKAFLAATVVTGAGLAVGAVKGAVMGTKLATSAVARAQTKTALKKAIKASAAKLAKKRTVKETLKAAGKGTFKGSMKAMEIEYKKSVVTELTGMVRKGIKK